MTHTTESGRSMVEMIAVLAIIGIISIGGISGISFGMKLFRSTSTQEMIESIATDVMDLYSWDREFPKTNGGMHDRICRNKIWETDCVAGETNATYKNPFGGNLAIKESSTGTYFTIEVTGLPTDICQNFQTTKWGSVSEPACSNTTFTATVP